MNSYKQSLYICVIRVIANIIMLGALFFAMYMAFRAIAWPAELVFCLYFFGITIPVWILAWLIVKFIRKTWPAEYESLVSLPGLGVTLVRWNRAEKNDKCKLWR